MTDSNLHSRLQQATDKQEESNAVFKNKHLLSPDYVVDSERIVGRDEEMDAIIKTLADFLNGVTPNNLYIHGGSGTGKTLITNAVADVVAVEAANKGIDFAKVGIVGKNIKSYTKACYQLLLSIGDATGTEIELPSRGISASAYFDRFFEIVEAETDAVLVILDEFDTIVGRGKDPAYSDLVYELSRTQSNRGISSHVSIAALTNSGDAVERMGSRARSSFDPERLFFSDYTADALREILKRRQDAFLEDALDDSAIPLAAAQAAQNNGEARQAISFLRAAGELANSEGDEVVTEDHVRKAAEVRLYTEREEVFRNRSPQKRVTLYAAAAALHYADRDLERSPYPVAYEIYERVQTAQDKRVRTRRSFQRYLDELETYDLIKEISRQGRGHQQGTHNEATLNIDPEIIVETIEEDIEDTVDTTVLAPEYASSDDEISDVLAELVPDFIDDFLDGG